MDERQPFLVHFQNFIVIAEDKKTLVNHPMESSNTLLHGQWCYQRLLEWFEKLQYRYFTNFVYKSRGLIINN